MNCAFCGYHPAVGHPPNYISKAEEEIDGAKVAMVTTHTCRDCGNSMWRALRTAVNAAQSLRASGYFDHEATRLDTDEIRGR